VHLAFENARDFLSTNGGLHDRVDVADRDAIACRLCAIYADNQIRLADKVKRRWVSHAGHPRNLGFDRLGQAFQLGEIASEDLHRILALHAGHCLLDIVLNVL
jgi:hypothetical protein